MLKLMSHDFIPKPLSQISKHPLTGEECYLGADGEYYPIHAPYEVATIPYSSTVGRDICYAVLNGASLLTVSKKLQIPLALIDYWARLYPDFSLSLDLCLKRRAGFLVEEVIDLKEDFASCSTPAETNALKARIETNFKLAEKLDPDKWGDKSRVDHTMSPSVIVIDTGINKTQTIVETSSTKIDSGIREIDND